MSLYYPKIETLYQRDKTTFKVTSELRMPEFGLVSLWYVTEKIDGTNVRIELTEDGRVEYGGRTERAQHPSHLMNYLLQTLPPEKIKSAFDGGNFVLFGEGYGAKIQKGGGNYRGDPCVKLFDVACIKDGVPLWLEWENVEGIAGKLGIETVPIIGVNLSLEQAIKLVNTTSVVAEIEGGAAGVGVIQEGVVARTRPMLLDRRGHRIMWKLKNKDVVWVKTQEKKHEV